MLTKKVILPRGIPGSGKSTWVSEQLATHPAGTAVRLNNDDLSVMLYGQLWGNMFNNASKELLHHLRLAMLETFLKQEYITHVYVDNTNLAVNTVKALQDVALLHGAEFIVVDDFLNVPIEECIERDSKRDRVVGADVIRKMAKPIEKLKPWVLPEIPVIEKYDNEQDLPEVVICDIDGTLALMDGRTPYDYSLIHTDKPYEAVVDLVYDMWSLDVPIIFMSGRSDDSREQTKAWLNTHVLAGDLDLYMRKTGDYRPDWIVKYELFQEHIAGKYRVKFVLDDRNQVVELWRNKLGLSTFQVAEGNF
jgi:predicted kinase